MYVLLMPSAILSHHINVYILISSVKALNAYGVALLCSALSRPVSHLSVCLGEILKRKSVSIPGSRV